MARLDPHSYNDSTQPETESLDWKARVDFRTRRLHAEATLTLKEASAGPLDLDTRDLEIRGVVDPSGRPCPSCCPRPSRFWAAGCGWSCPPGLRQLTVRYRTSPGASALQWLTPAQTAGRPAARSSSASARRSTRARVVPLQDTPRVRHHATRAELTVPAALRR